MFSFEGTHFKEQALFIKKMVDKYKASMLIVDANGMGVGLVDFLVLEIDEHPAYEVVNDERYNRYKTDDSLPILYNIKTSQTGHKDPEIDRVFANMIGGKKVKMLVSESQARSLPHIQSIIKDERKKDTEEMEKQKGIPLQRSYSEKLARELLPYSTMDLLQDEIMNLEFKASGSTEGKAEQISKRITKDKWSAFKYGLYWIHMLERKNQVRTKERADSWRYIGVRKAKSIL